MKWPKLVPDRVCNAQVEIHLTQGVTESGAPKKVDVISRKCNYSEKSKQIMTAERQLVTLSGSILMDGDIAPQLEQLEGYVKINGGTVERMIHRSARGRNPDNTVNYTQLELI